jgi:DNA-binding response OmpR family regulator
MEMVAEQLRRRGWDVHTANPDEAVRATIRRNAHAVVILTESACESGYLTAVKIRKAKPKARVVLVGERTAKAEKMARFVGAEFVAEADGLCGVLTAFATARA